MTCVLGMNNDQTKSDNEVGESIVLTSWQTRQRKRVQIKYFLINIYLLDFYGEAIFSVFTKNYGQEINILLLQKCCEMFPRKNWFPRFIMNLIVY